MNTDEHDDPAEPSERAAREALAWHVRLNDPVAGAADRAAFGNWLDRSPDHRRAYAEAEDLWTRLAGPAARLGAGGWYRVPSAAPAMAAPRRRLRLAPAFALAASVALALAGLWWRDPGLVDRALADYATSPGERREAVLADGSRLVLDGDSAVSVTLDGTERRVDLRRGRVWVDVVHKPDSGFSVRAGGVEARVLGTAFDVDRQDGAVTVTVERGRVAVAARDRGDEGMGDGVVLTAGQRVRMTPGQPAAAQAVSADTAFAWRRGLLVFDRAPLGEVAVALDRMSAGRVLIADDALRGLTLSGVFRADDSGAVLDALRSALGVRTSGLPGVATLIHR